MKYIIIIGCGRTGRELAGELSDTANVVAVDKTPRSLALLGAGFNGKKVLGDGMDLNLLEKEAGLGEAAAVFLLTGNDNLNLVMGKVIRHKFPDIKVVLQINDAVKKKIFGEEGLTILNRAYLIVEVLKKCISG